MASTQVETVSTAADKAKMGAAAALIIAGLAGFYLLGRQGQLVQWGVLLLGVAAAVVVFLTSWPGKEFIGYSRDSIKETKKVVWPQRRETIQMTAYVFGFVVLMALFLWATDKVLEWTFYDLILGWK
ncbi:MAG TPA: preprotein translocase subunit SecE [Ramlibacter sp.]|nr:preprotein translocase subunit SecE [Ramlibacter sp.]